MSAIGFVDVEDRGEVRWLTLSNPDRKNAVPRSAWPDLAHAFRDFEHGDARVLVLRGAGDSFCSGADLALDVIDDLSSAAAGAATMRATADTALALHRVSKPTVAAVDGGAVGAGMSLALGCDVVVATDRASFAESFVRRGLSLDLGGTWLLPRLVGLARARELALTGRRVDAAEALEIGLVSRVVTPERLEEVVTEIAEHLAAGAPLAQRFIKVGLDRSWTMSFEQALEFEDQAQAVLLASSDVREGVAAFLDKRDPEFKGR